MPGSHPKKRKLYGMLLRMVFQSNFSQTILNQQTKNLLIYHRKYDRLYHVKVISYFHARVAQGWSTTLPRWGPRVRIPSRALLFSAGGLHCLFSGLLFLSDSRLIYKMGRRPHGSAFPFLYLISDCRASIPAFTSSV